MGRATIRDHDFLSKSFLYQLIRQSIRFVNILSLLNINQETFIGNISVGAQIENNNHNTTFSTIKVSSYIH